MRRKWRLQTKINDFNYVYFVDRCSVEGRSVTSLINIDVRHTVYARSDMDCFEYSGRDGASAITIIPCWFLPSYHPRPSNGSFLILLIDCSTRPSTRYKHI